MAFSRNDFPLFCLIKDCSTIIRSSECRTFSYLTRHYFFAIELPSKGQDSSLGSSQREAHMNNGSTQSMRGTKKEGETELKM